MENDYRYFKKGIFPILIASLLWGLGYFLRKIIIREINPFLLTFFVSLIVSLTIIIFKRVSPQNIIKIFKGNPWKYTWLSIFGTVLGTTFMFFGLRLLDLSIVTLLEKLQPIFVVILAVFFLKEKFKKILLPYIIATIISSYFISTKTPFQLNFSSSELIGIVAVISAAICWAIASIIGKRLSDDKNRSTDITLMRFAIAGIVLLPIFLFKNQLNLTVIYSFRLIFIVVFSAIICTALAYYLYYSGLKHVKASTAGFLELTTPIISILLGILFLNESLVTTQFISIPILLFCIYKISTIKIK